MTVSIESLTERFGPALDVPKLGKCLAIPGSEFDPDWEVLLGDQGFEVIFETWDNHPMTVVPLKIHGDEGKKVEKTKVAIKGKSAQAGPDWGENEVTLLLERWEAMKELPKVHRAAMIAKMPEFVGRSANGILQKAYKLLKEKTSKEVKKSPESEVSVAAVPVKVDGADVLVDLVKNYQILSEANEKLNSAYVELRTKFEDLTADIEKKQENTIKWVVENYAESEELDAIQKQLAGHEHSEKSGKAMMPLEAS